MTSLSQAFNANEQYFGVISTVHRGKQTNMQGHMVKLQATLWAKKNPKKTTLSSLSINTHMRRKPPNIYCDLLSHHPHLHHTEPLLTWTCPLRDYPIPCCSWAPTTPLLPPSPPPNMSPVGGVMSGFCGGLLMTGPDNQRVCKCQCVIFKSLFMVRVLKEDIFMVIVAGLFYYIFM